MLYSYAESIGLELPLGEGGQFLDTDTLFPDLALNHLGLITGISFLLGVIAASFSSVDSALTALTTSFTYDFLDISHRPAAEKRKWKNRVLFGFSLVVYLIIMVFSNSRGDVISLIFNVAGYTYGPLLGLYLLGMFSRVSPRDKWVPIICLASPLLTYALSVYLKNSFNFDFGFISIAVNALLTIIGMILIKNRS